MTSYISSLRLHPKLARATYDWFSKLSTVFAGDLSVVHILHSLMSDVLALHPEFPVLPAQID